MNYEFDNWLYDLDMKVQEQLGISINDLPDAPYWDMFDEGMTVENAYKFIVRQEFPDLDEEDNDL